MKSNDPYRELFERSPDAILIMEGDRFVDCNPAAARMLGFPDQKTLLALGLHPADISPPRQPDGRSSFEKAEECLIVTFERGTHTFEWTHLREDGETFLVEVQLTLVRRGDKPLLHVVWRDISERKWLEAELRQAQRLEAVGRLAGGVAHDFNNMLVVILGHAELLEEEFKTGKPDPHHVDEIRSVADRAAALTGQLLSFSRGQPKQSRPTDLFELVEQLDSLLRTVIDQNIELELKRHDGPLTVIVDPSQFEQVVMNLAANARDAMPDGGSLEISVGPHRITSPGRTGHLPAGDYVALRASDTGEGMTSEQIDRAFEPFYTTKTLGKGTGLGLATVHGIAKQNGGHASIESAPGRGTTVEVLLPLSDRELVPLEQPPRQIQSPGGRETILLVEDEPAIRELLERALKVKGYRVLTASDGQEALERLARSRETINLLVTDVVMPRVSGPELVRQLATIWPRVKVLYMSGYSQEGHLDLTVDDELTAVLQKPFSPRRFQAEVRRILDRDPAGTDPN